MLSKSYVHGSSSANLLGETLGTNFDAAAERWGDREALVVRHQNLRWTYKDLKKRVDAAATWHCGEASIHAGEDGVARGDEYRLKRVARVRVLGWRSARRRERVTRHTPHWYLTSARMLRFC